jgi:hypothetical protein
MPPYFVPVVQRLVRDSNLVRLILHSAPALLSASPPRWSALPMICSSLCFVFLISKAPLIGTFQIMTGLAFRGQVNVSPEDGDVGGPNFAAMRMKAIDNDHGI